eukprot:CAMPEP_0114532964 /NCGR_PEP_ID=MMETSP0109-20121206/26970_1 /TAXON_ID=29199 /ORGANISM="Chlorarachnion reptans, Strain CCCM449" /LENGTH=585 /DNA_ID=CAMNT_0001716111 /DNA_START=255 /DNA_END=2012 /DNA_ORIENTATION=-
MPPKLSYAAMLRPQQLSTPAVTSEQAKKNVQAASSGSTKGSNTATRSTPAANGHSVIAKTAPAVKVASPPAEVATGVSGVDGEKPNNGAAAHNGRAKAKKGKKGPSQPSSSSQNPNSNSKGKHKSSGYHKDSNQAQYHQHHNSNRKKHHNGNGNQQYYHRHSNASPSADPPENPVSSSNQIMSNGYGDRKEGRGYEDRRHPRKQSYKENQKHRQQSSGGHGPGRSRGRGGYGRGRGRHRGRHRGGYQGYRQQHQSQQPQQQQPQQQQQQQQQQQPQPLMYGRYPPQYLYFEQYAYPHAIPTGGGIVPGMANMHIAQAGFRPAPQMGQMRAPVQLQQQGFYPPQMPMYNQMSSSNVTPQVLSQMCGPQQSGGAPIFSIDVECVATGPQHNKRAVAQIALVDQNEKVRCNLIVKPKEKVFSYLTGLTGLTKEIIDQKGVSFDDAINEIKRLLPSNAVLVGQNILKDVQWVGLIEGKDFQGMRDLAGLYRVYNQNYKKYTYFSLQHEARALLAVIQEEPHDAATDAIISVRLYNLYQNISKNPRLMQAVEALLLNTPVEKSFAAKYPVYDKVCMGRRKECKCGAPFFY